MQLYNFLTPGNALIFRIVHIDNIEWILDNGLYCRNSKTIDPNYVDIGSVEIIDRRLQREVNVAPFGTLSDYIPFYFTPSSLMLLNVLTGHNVPQRSHEDIIILAVQLTNLAERGIKYVYTDRHALLKAARFFNDLGMLETIIFWHILQKRDFTRNNDDPEKLERYMAEALVFKFLPIDAVSSFACATPESTEKITQLLQKRNLGIKTITRPDWFFL